MEQTLNRSKSIDSFKRAITRRRNQIQKQPGYDMENQGMYESTLNTILQAGDEWYHPEKKEDQEAPKRYTLKDTGGSIDRIRDYLMNNQAVVNLPDEHKAEVSQALEDAHKTFNRSKDFNSYQKNIHKKRFAREDQEKSSSNNDEISYYLKTLNTISAMSKDWYYPKENKPTTKKETPTSRDIATDSDAQRSDKQPVKKQRAKTKTSAHSLTELRIKQDMVNAGLDPESHDVSSLIDKTLNYRENRANVAQQLGYSYRQKDKKEAKQRADHHQCIQAQERCEVHGDDGACLQYYTMGCHKTYGELDR